jgi:hypothetical protein
MIAEFMGVGTVAEIPRELVKSIQSSVTVDWFSREAVVPNLSLRLLPRHERPGHRRHQRRGGEGVAVVVVEETPPPPSGTAAGADGR